MAEVPRGGGTSPTPGWPLRARRPGGRERVAVWAFAACAAVTALMTVGIFAVLLSETLRFFRMVSPWEFITATRWTPLFRDKHFGLLPLFTASLQVAVGAAILALPAGVLTATFLSEYAGRRLRAFLRFFLDVAAGIPTVVYGYFALTFLTPGIRTVFPGVEIFNAASAAMVVGIMILPTVASLSEDALRAVPLGCREAAYGLGASKVVVTSRVVLPAAGTGILGSCVLALARAFGETMVVTIAAGNSPRLTFNPLESVQTMSAYLVQVGLGPTSSGTLEYQTLFAVGGSLFLITWGVNWAGNRIRPRFGESHNG